MLHRILRVAVATPFYRLGICLIRECVNLHSLGNHERGVETEAKVAYYVLILIFLQKFAGRAERYLVDVFINLLARHTYTVISYGDCLYSLLLTLFLARKLGFSNYDIYCQVAEFVLEFSLGCESLHLLSRIHGICHYLADENIVIAVEKFLDYRKNVFGGYTDFTLSLILCHIVSVLFVIVVRTQAMSKRIPAATG